MSQRSTYRGVGALQSSERCDRDDVQQGPVLRNSALSGRADRRKRSLDQRGIARSCLCSGSEALRIASGCSPCAAWRADAGIVSDPCHAVGCCDRPDARDAAARGNRVGGWIARRSRPDRISRLAAPADPLQVGQAIHAAIPFESSVPGGAGGPPPCDRGRLHRTRGGKKRSPGRDQDPARPRPGRSLRAAQPAAVCRRQAACRGGVEAAWPARPGNRPGRTFALRRISSTFPAAGGAKTAPQDGNGHQPGRYCRDAGTHLPRGLERAACEGPGRLRRRGQPADTPLRRHGVAGVGCLGVNPGIWREGVLLRLAVGCPETGSRAVLCETDRTPGGRQRRSAPARRSHGFGCRRARCPGRRAGRCGGGLRRIRERPGRRPGPRNRLIAGGGNCHSHRILPQQVHGKG